MAGNQPQRVGTYELVADFEAPGASLRILRMARTDQAVGLHLHRRSTQVYVALEGRVAVERDGQTTVIENYGMVVIAPGVVHAASPAGKSALLLNISMPPMLADDQIPVPRLHGAGHA